MLRCRITPCLLVHNNGLVKTVEFKEPKYVGDPINAVKIFNEKQVDELIVLDIDATVQNRSPQFDLIEKLASECRMPLCYGGGVTTVSEAKRIINLGAEKVAISSAAIQNPSLLSEIGKAVGVQSVVVVLDIRKKGNTYELYTHNGKKATGIKVHEFVPLVDKIGIGELVVNSIDYDGKMKGYDFKLVDLVRDLTEAPITILGGAGSLDDIRAAISRYKIIGAAAGSLFVFRGKYRAVLINYPNPTEKKGLYCQDK